MKSFIFLFLLISLTAQAQVEKSIMKSGVKLNLKTSTKVGLNATIAKYCDTNGRNCQELVVTNEKKSISIPVASGPVYNIIKTGKTANFTGMTKRVFTNKKLTQYYIVAGNTQTIVTPIKKSFVISIFKFGNNKNVKSGNINVFKPIGPRQQDDECKCLEKYEDCYVATSINFQDNDLDGYLSNLLIICDFNYEDCQKECDGIVIEKIENIIVFRNSAAANGFQIGIKN